jgi:hypothetical protein
MWERLSRRDLLFAAVESITAEKPLSLFSICFKPFRLRIDEFML